jgi:hypothetical protein
VKRSIKGGYAERSAFGDYAGLIEFETLHCCRMTLSIRVDGVDAYGIELLSPTRPEFDELARPLLGERIADLALRLSPC